MLGSHRSPEAVLMPYGRYRELAEAGSAALTLDGIRRYRELILRLARESHQRRRYLRFARERGRDSTVTPTNRSERWLEDLRHALTTAANPDRFGDPIWSQAVRTRDFVVHHYQRIDLGSLWLTVSASLPALADRLDA